MNRSEKEQRKDMIRRRIKYDKIHNSKLILWTLTILIQMFVIQSIDVRAETTDLPDEQIVIYSGIYEDKNQAAVPADQYIDEDGQQYQLIEWEVIAAETEERTRIVEKVVRYPAVEGADRIPQSIEVEVADGGRSVTAVCSLEQETVNGSHWETGFTFPVVFHQYDSDYYLLQGIQIPYNMETPELDSYESHLLDLIGLSAKEYRITSVQWAGPEYQNTEGEWCRDAIASGEKLVKEVEAQYRGQAILPAYPGWQSKAVYGKLTEPAATVAEPQSDPVPVIIEEPAEEPSAAPPVTLWQKIINTLLITVGIGALVFFTGLLFLLLLHLVKKVRTCYNKRH